MYARRISLVVTLALLVLGPAPPAAASTFVPTRFDDPPPGTCDPGDCSLREAILAANGSAGADQIVLAAGTYTLGIVGTDENAAANGDLDITDHLTITGAGREATVIDGNGSVTGERVLDVDPVPPGAGPTVMLSSLTVRGGSDSPAASGGGGIHNSHLAKLTLVDVAVTANQTDGPGAGIFNLNDASLSITGGAVSGNATTGIGGGIAVWNDSKATLTDVRVSGNTAVDFGGGIQIWNETTLGLADVTISGNAAGLEGGGIAIWNEPTVNLTNTTVSANQAKEHGGGIYAKEQAIVTLANVTATGNTADSDLGGNPGDGGGVYVLPGFTGTFGLRNSIVAGNHDPSSEPDCSGAFTSQGYNLIGQVSAGCSFMPTTGDQTGTPGAPLDVKLGPLANNGGPTQTHGLLPESPAIDSAGPTAPPTDQRGAPRAGAPDIGAYELVRCRGRVVNLVGTAISDSLTGTPGKDGVLALGGKDKLRGKGGADGLCGGPGKDTLRGGGGKDKLDGGPGKDTCVGQGGKDKAKACEKEKSIP